MLLRFRVENHASLRDEQELLLVTSDRCSGRAGAEVPGWAGSATVPVAAIFGPNASGKSNVIDAMSWMRWVVLSSYRQWDPTGGVPRRPFQFRVDADSYPTEVQVDFVADGVRYEYGFSVNDTKVLSESLFYYPEGRSRRLYERDDNNTVTFGRWLTGRRKTIADSLRPNSLFLSVAAAQGHKQLGRVFRWFRFGIRVASDRDLNARVDHTMHLLLRNDVHPESRAVSMLLSFADLGASELTGKELDETDTEDFQKVRQALRDALGDRVLLSRGQRYKDVQVVHRTTAGEFALPLALESHGTQTWIGLLGVVVSTLRGGDVLLVDELDAGLHPLLVDALVRIFTSPDTNKRGAQLIFTTHDVTLLGRRASAELLRDQIWLTEKDPATLATHFFPLTEFPVRDSDNFEQRYLLGRYGALPYLEEDFPQLLAELLEHEDIDAGQEADPAEEELGTAGTASLPHLL